MQIPEVLPSWVAEQLRDDDRAVYLDVRTVPEFVAGHPRGALNVPMYLVEPATGQPYANPEFVRVTAAHLTPDQRVFCGCATGVRSLHAAMLLRRHGYLEVANVGPGFNGRNDPLTGVQEPGWAALGLPVVAGDDEERGYAALRRAVEPAS